MDIIGHYHITMKQNFHPISKESQVINDET